MGSVYIHIGMLNKLDVGVLLLFTNLSFCKNMEVVLVPMSAILLCAEVT